MGRSAVAGRVKKARRTASRSLAGKVKKAKRPSAKSKGKGHVVHATRRKVK
jgi:hypothetical protein